MTQREIDGKRYDLQSFIADKIRDIGSQSHGMRSADDRSKVLQCCIKIQDCIDDIRKSYDKIDDLDLEIPEEDTDENDMFLTKFQ